MNSRIDQKKIKGPENKKPLFQFFDFGCGNASAKKADAGNFQAPRSWDHID